MHQRLIGGRVIRGLMVVVASFGLLLPLACHSEQEASKSRIEPYFQLMRARDLLLRMDTRTGQTWSTPIDNAVLWEKLGDPADLAGLPADPGRFRLNQLSGRGIGASTRLIRDDVLLGTTWVMVVAPGSLWRPIDEAGGADTSGEPPAAANAPAPAAQKRAAAAPPSDTDMPPVPPVPEGKADVPPDVARENVQGFADAIGADVPVNMRIWAVKQLGRYDAELAGPHLLVALSDTSPEVVVAAIDSLTKIGYSQALPAILKLKNHPSTMVRLKVKEAIEVKRD